LLKRCFKPGFCYWKAGVIVDGLVPAAIMQPDMFNAGHPERDKRLMAALDGITHRFGRGTLQIASCGLEPAWKMQQEKLLPSFTPVWRDLPVVKALNLLLASLTSVFLSNSQPEGNGLWF